MKADKDKLTADQDNQALAKRIALVVFDGVEILDVAGPISVFAKANSQIPGSYRIDILAARDGFIESNSGISIKSHGCWSSVAPHSIDTLIIAGGHEDIALSELRREDLAIWIKSVAAKARRVASVCTGAFALGEAKLLEGRRSTTHWSACSLLQSVHPDSMVVNDEIFVRDGKIWTSAGILTGIDLALALVEEDLGKECALNVARLLVVAGMRPGQSPQISPLLDSQSQASNPIKDLLTWIHQHLASDLQSERLAERMAMSTRHFNRVFRSQIGITPAKYVHEARLDRAIVLLRDTTWCIEKIASKSGFDSVDTLQRGLKRRAGISPTEYRNAFLAK